MMKNNANLWHHPMTWALLCELSLILQKSMLKDHNDYTDNKTAKKLYLSWMPTVEKILIKFYKDVIIPKKLESLETS